MRYRPLIAAAMITLAACTADGGAQTQLGLDEGRQLASFAAGNPECQLWTDWKRMCSRTGPDGQMSCSADAEMPVEPSAPFCAVSSDGLGVGSRIKTKEQWLSEARFCDEHAEAASSQSGISAGPKCSRYAETRPFNGYRLAARAHSWCRVWKDKKTLQLVHPASARLDSSASRNGYYCAVRDVPQWCAAPRGFGLTPSNSPEFPDPNQKNESGIYVLGTYDRDMLNAVVGIYCGRK